MNNLTYIVYTGSSTSICVLLFITTILFNAYDNNHLPCLYHVCTMFVPCLYHVCTMFVSCLYHVGTMFVPCLYHVCTMFVPCLYHVCTMLVPCWYHVCTMFSSSLLSVNPTFDCVPEVSLLLHPDENQ